MELTLEAIREAGGALFATGAFALEVAAFLIIVVAAGHGLSRTAVAAVKRQSELLQRIRLDFGKALVLALEFLVAADVLKTAVAPSREAVVVVAIVVVIRTVLSVTIEWEMRRVRQEEQEEARARAA